MREPSGQFVVRIPPELHRRLKEVASRQGSSLNQVCVERLHGRSGELSPSYDTTTSPVPRSLIAAILERWGADLAGLLLFGSAARGEAARESDIDLLLVFTPAVKLSRRLYVEWDLLSNNLAPEARRVSPQFVILPEDAHAAGGLWFEVAVEGVVLWERDLSVSNLLRRIREAMARGELRRDMIHGNPYWIKLRGGSDEK